MLNQGPPCLKWLNTWPILKPKILMGTLGRTQLNQRLSGCQMLAHAHLGS
jgi:hypothetical protein